MAVDGRAILGTNIKKYRTSKGWNQEALAKKVRLKKETISRVENGRQNISIDNLLKIAAALGVSLEELSMENPSSIPLRFVISEHNIQTLKGLLESIHVMFENKERKKDLDKD